VLRASRSHALALHFPRLFQPPRSRNSPTLPALACSCNGVSHAQPSTYRIGQSKSKNPAKHSVVLALGESNSKAIELVKRLACRTTRPHRTLRGSTSSIRPVATPDAAIIHQFFAPCNVDRTCRAFFLATETPCRVASIRPTVSQPHGSRPADGPALQPIPLWQCRLVWSFFAFVKFSWVYNRAVKPDRFVGALKIVVAWSVNLA